MKVLRVLFQFNVLLISLELLLRLFSVNETYNEKLWNTYQYVFKSNQTSWYKAGAPNITYDYIQDEFSFKNVINELGHRERPFEYFIQDSTDFKIICLGDSFTEGDGAPYDSSWVRFFESKLSAELDTNVAAYNAGVCGSDVVFNHIMLKDKLIQSEPDLVLECLNNSDLYDIYYRGGAERFGTDGTILSPKAKWWEPWFKYSYVFRAAICTFGPYDQNLVNQNTFEEDELKSFQIIADQVQKNREICEARNIPYYLILMPSPAEINHNVKNKFKALQVLLPIDFPFIDIYPSQFKTYNRIAISEYSWEKNGHFNAKGYQLMGEAIFNEYKFIQSKRDPLKPL